MRGTLSDQFRDKHPFFWVVVVAAVFAVCSWSFTVAMQYKYVGLDKLGYDFQQEGISRVYPNGPAAGKLQVGDMIRAINGKPLTPTVFFEEMVSTPVGTTYLLEVERNGKREQVELKMMLCVATNAADAQRTAILGSLVAFCMLLIAILAGLLRPSDSMVRLFSTALMIVGLGFPRAVQFLGLLNETERLVWQVFSLFEAPFIPLAVIFHLFLRFPPGLPVSRFWQFVKWGMYLVTAPLHLSYRWFLGTGKALFFSTESVGLQIFGFLCTAVPILILVIIRNYRLVKEPQQKQRIKWVLSTVVAAGIFFLLPTVFGLLIRPRFFSGTSAAAEMIFQGLEYLARLVMLGNLAAWAYAILKHRVLDINVVIRRSLRYLLASRGFILIEVLLAFAVLSFIFAGRIGAALDRLGSNTRTLVTILGTVLMVLGLQTVNRKIRPLIDRRFFREAYDAQQILTELTSSLRATTNVNEVLELTTAKIQQALYAANVTIFLRNGRHDFRSAVSRDYHEREKSSQSVSRELHLPDEAFVVQRINDSAQPAEIDWDDPYSPIATQLATMASGDAAAQQEFDTLRVLQTNLVLPLAAKDELLGVLALGPRAGDLPYSREDKRMLMNVAGQTAMALENSRLIEQKIDLEAENERRAQELEEARQLQLSMLPKRLPDLPHLDIAAYMKTASEVGGDYYDFHLGDDGTLTIAVGDATGHGLRAGTLVASVKSLFVSLAYHPDIAHIFTRMSRVLKEMKLRGLFMAMTMVKMKGQQLSVSIAGMPSVLIYRAATSTVEEIAMRALPLGGVAKYQYQQQELSLATNDVVVLMSDGLPERFNPQGEMLEDERIRAALPALAAQSSEAIIAALVRFGDEWAAGRAQDDDITFVVLKIKEQRNQL